VRQVAANVSRVDMNQYEHLRATRRNGTTQKALEELSRYDFYFTEVKHGEEAAARDGWYQGETSQRKILVITDYGQLMTEEEDRGFIGFRLSLVPG